jgi:hypothetical protein
VTPSSKLRGKGASIRVNTGATLTTSHDGAVAHLTGLLSNVACQDVIDAAERSQTWAAQLDTVDRRPEWQHTIYDGSMFMDKELIPLVEELAHCAIIPALSASLGLDAPSLVLSWAFVRAYSSDRRQSFPVHRDRSAATANILLTHPRMFEGAELFALGDRWAGAEKWNDKEFKRKLPERVLRAAPHKVDYDQGECVMHLGKQLHGVLPLASGQRHVLILMFEKKA